jgi:hypothetical protein
MHSSASSSRRAEPHSSLTIDATCEPGWILDRFSAPVSADSSGGARSLHALLVHKAGHPPEVVFMLALVVSVQQPPESILFTARRRWSGT